MHIAYILWSKGNDSSDREVASEAAVSIASVRHFMPEAEITVFLSERFGFFKPFLNAFVDHTDKTVYDKRKSLMTKLFTFQYMLSRLKKFVYLDADTIVRRNFAPEVEKVEQPIYLASYPSSPLLKMAHPDIKYLRKKFHLKKKITKRPCTCMLYVNQTRDEHFWTRFRETLAAVISEYKIVVEPNVNIARDGLGGLVNDESYFAILFSKMYLDITDFVFHKRAFNSYKTIFLKHKGATYLRPTSLGIQRCLQMAKEKQVSMKFFNYPRLRQ